MPFRQISIFFAAISISAVAPVNAQDASEAPPFLDPYVGDNIRGGEWRSSNPDYEPGSDQPAEYGLRYDWGPYKQHMTGELLGIYPSDEGEKEILYWTLYAFWNPVTKVVTALQINWNGSTGDGTMSLGENGEVIIEQIFFGIDGSETHMRHVEFMAPDKQSFLSVVHEKDDKGEWVLKDEWTWKQTAKKKGEK